jgi:uncharacterized protein YukE
MTDFTGYTHQQMYDMVHSMDDTAIGNVGQNFSNAQTQLENLTAAYLRQVSEIQQSWQGKAADNYFQFAAKYRDKASTLSDQLGNVGAALSNVSNAIYEAKQNMPAVSSAETNLSSAQATLTKDQNQTALNASQLSTAQSRVTADQNASSTNHAQAATVMTTLASAYTNQAKQLQTAAGTTSGASGSQSGGKVTPTSTTTAAASAGTYSTHASYSAGNTTSGGVSGVGGSGFKAASPSGTSGGTVIPPTVSGSGTTGGSTTLAGAPTATVTAPTVGGTTTLPGAGSGSPNSGIGISGGVFTPGTTNFGGGGGSYNVSSRNGATGEYNPESHGTSGEYGTGRPGEYGVGGGSGDQYINGGLRTGAETTDPSRVGTGDAVTGEGTNGAMPPGSSTDEEGMMGGMGGGAGAAGDENKRGQRAKYLVQDAEWWYGDRDNVLPSGGLVQE